MNKKPAVLILALALFGSAVWAALPDFNPAGQGQAILSSVRGMAAKAVSPPAADSRQGEAFRLEAHGGSFLGLGHFRVTPESQAMLLNDWTTLTFADASSGNYDTTYLRVSFDVRVQRMPSDPEGIYRLGLGVPPRGNKYENRLVLTSPPPQLLDLSRGMATVKIQAYISFYSPDTGDPWNPAGFYRTKPRTVRLTIRRADRS